MSSAAGTPLPSIHKRKESLSQLLSERPMKDELYDMGIAVGEDILAASLQPCAFDLQLRLSSRIDREDLIRKGIIQPSISVKYKKKMAKKQPRHVGDRLEFEKTELDSGGDELAQIREEEKAAALEDMGEREPVDFHIGDRIRLLKGSTGVVRFHGEVPFSEDKLVGVELDQWNVNGHNGTVDGDLIFACREGHGYFAAADEIIENIGSTKKLRRQSVVLPSVRPSDRGNLRLGDRVQLSRGKTGVVKYIGPAHFLDEDVIGLELDSWWVMGHDGTKDAQKYFEASPGRGYFARRQSISHIILPKDLATDDVIAMATKKRQNRISHLKKQLLAIEELQERKFGGEKLTKTQLEKIERFEQYTDELNRLQVEFDGSDEDFEEAKDSSGIGAAVELVSDKLLVEDFEDADAKQLTE